MANKRMFSKSITNSSAFLKMPATSRLLYYDLGMNADDDGFVEHFMVLRMTGASQQDLGVLELNGLIKIFDENVLWIKDWKENNYIRNDRYTPSKYLSIYSLDTIGIPVGIPEVDTGKNRLGKISIDNNIFKPPTLEEITEYCHQRKNNIDPKAFYDYFDVSNWVDSKGNKVKNWKQKIITWEKNNIKDKNDLPKCLKEEIKQKEQLTKEEQKEMNNLFKEFN
jgi:hypothetical protein